MVGIENYRPLLDRFVGLRPIRADYAETAIIHHGDTETRKKPERDFANFCRDETLNACGVYFGSLFSDAPWWMICSI